MNDREWVSKLAVGDLVVVYQTGSKSAALKRVTAVTKQNGGTICIGTQKFNMGGSERGQHGYHWDYLTPATPEMIDEIERNNVISDIVTITSGRGWADGISTDVLRQVLTLIGRDC